MTYVCPDNRVSIKYTIVSMQSVHKHIGEHPNPHMSDLDPNASDMNSTMVLMREINKCHEGTGGYYI